MKYLVLIWMISAVVACQSIDDIKKPKNLIDKEKMADILYDIAMLNAGKSYSPVMMQESEIDYNEYIFKKHGIDSLQFAKSNAYYTDNLDKYLAVFTLVEDRIKAEKRKWSDTLVLEKKRRDSIQELERKARDTVNRAERVVKKIIPKASN
ncbi:MAG: DUF4296 domain-containing protein [Flavobacteriaceae bacterium]|nr:DUF4296 domain-containing protein [Flavobacteriaceae bacterium]MDZ4147460.1 DUF4296 domain-containing protein [Flavobacteriaceae bacterium]